MITAWILAAATTTCPFDSQHFRSAVTIRAEVSRVAEYDLVKTPGSAAGKTLLDETLVVVYAEFGRTLGPLNVQKGRDHHQRMSVVFAGGGVQGKRIIGKTNGVGDAATEYGWSADRNIRPEDIASTMYSALGIDYTTIRRDDPLGRGFEYVPFASDGVYQPVDELFIAG